MMMGKECNNFPVGYKFLPTDEELVTHYLMNKALFKPLPAQVIQDIDASAFFNKPPKNLEAVRYPNGEREWYFFIQKKEENENENEEKEEKIKVGDGKGFWKAIGEEETIYNSQGYPSAFKLHFNYYSETLLKPKKTHWKLVKYRLPTHKGQEWILLRLTRGMDYNTYF